MYTRSSSREDRKREPFSVVYFSRASLPKKGPIVYCVHICPETSAEEDSLQIGSTIDLYHRQRVCLFFSCLFFFVFLLGGVWYVSKLSCLVCLKIEMFGMSQSGGPFQAFNSPRKTRKSKNPRRRTDPPSPLTPKFMFVFPQGFDASSNIGNSATEAPNSSTLFARTSHG